MQVPAREWVKQPQYTTVLYFAQIVEEMFWHGARDTYRAPALDTYHRADELVRTHEELTRSGIIEDVILLPMFDEFLWYVSRDLTIKRHHQTLWEIVAEKLGDKQARSPGKIEAVRLFKRTIGPTYLRKCRDEIEAYAPNAKIKDSSEFRYLVENFFSYVINSGHAPEHIYYNVRKHFFDRELDHNPTREIQDFFRHFPCRNMSYRAFAWASADLAAVLEGEQDVTLKPHLHNALTAKHREFINEQTEKVGVSFDNIQAADLVGAAAECARLLAFARAIAYTGRPEANLSWSPPIIIAWDDYPLGTILGEPVSALMRRYRGAQSAAERVISARREIVLRGPLSDEDRNRLLNAINGYADAYQSESPATQLVSLWSSLEGILPTPTQDKPRIVTFIRDVVASQRRLHIGNQFRWLYAELAKAYGDRLVDALKPVSEYQEQVWKLFAALSFSHHDPTRTALGGLCANDPLARQKMLALHKAADTCGRMHEMLASHSSKVSWQILRIYRERNRIVHRANPSANVSTLIVNLNEYILGVFNTFFNLAEGQRTPFSVDELFSEISIIEDARERELHKLRARQVDPSNASLVAGLSLH
jgi:hypothetical protein